ncbi:hypothetical protein [Leptolyngbya sp. FACHB-16]|nr:hypothetical protein [Leptolyngbya sp. FACHB-16]MBD1913757.1 hypothetical protein [Leptolyngbya sp. FACHB-8]MBD2153207.1 hypothetical protein [Leptolyngbya sp. FACHB-16]
MGKNKLKKNGVVHKNENNGIDILGVDARQLGTAVASVLVAEIANAAVQRLSEKTFGSTKNKAGVEDIPDQADLTNDGSDTLSDTAQSGRQAARVESSVGEAAQKVRSSLSDVTLSLSDVVNVLRDAGQRLKDQSGSVMNTSSDTVLNGIASGATALLERVSPDTQESPVKSKKGSKHHKKKHKKKKH